MTTVEQRALAETMLAETAPKRGIRDHGDRGARRCLWRYRNEPFKTAIDRVGGEATPSVALGIPSFVVWTLLTTTSLKKYVAIVMRADNEKKAEF